MGKFDKLNSEFNLEDFDAAQLTKALSEHQNTVIKALLIIATVVLMVMMFNDHSVKSRDITSKLAQAQVKLDAMKARDKAIQDFKDFEAALPKNVNEVELITMISNYKKVYHVNISSLNPTESKDMGLYDVINVGFTAQSEDFKSMMLFLRKIEKAAFPLRVDSWSGHEEENGKVDFNVSISAVLIHT